MILKNIQQLLQGNYRMSVKNIVSKLSTPEKIELYNCLYTDLAGKGIGGDTELAHVNTEEMKVLRDMGGSGTVNPNTGLIQFMGGSPGGSPAPAPSSTVQTKETIPEELKPYVTDVLEKAQALQERREEEGYVPFAGPRIARFAPEQEQAFAGVQALQGASQPYFRTAEALTASSALAPNTASVGQFMNPYIQNVIDIQTREAERTADVERQRLAQRGVEAGAFGGSRQAILESEANRNLQQRLGDIQARGFAAAFEDAQNRLAQQRNRERSAGSQFASLATAVPGQTLRELSALETVGTQRRNVGQQALDIAQQEYEVARTFPERTLQDYQSIIRGYSAPIPASTIQRTTGTTQSPSAFQQLGGLGLAALGTAGAFGAFNKKEGGLVGLANGTGQTTIGGKGKLEQGADEGSVLQSIFNFLKPKYSLSEDPRFIASVKRGEAAQQKINDDRFEKIGLDYLAELARQTGQPFVASAISRKDAIEAGKLPPMPPAKEVATRPEPKPLTETIMVPPMPQPIEVATRPEPKTITRDAMAEASKEKPSVTPSQIKTPTDRKQNLSETTPVNTAPKVPVKNPFDMQKALNEYIELQKKKPSSDQLIKEAEESRKQNLYATLANVGFKMMGQEKGRPFLTALGKAAEGSVKDLAKINSDYKSALKAARGVDAERRKEEIMLRMAAGKSQAETKKLEAQTEAEKLNLGPTAKGMTDAQFNDAITASVEKFGKGAIFNPFSNDPKIAVLKNNIRLIMDEEVAKLPPSLRRGAGSVAARERLITQNPRIRKLIEEFYLKNPSPRGGTPKNNTAGQQTARDILREGR